MSVGPSLRNKDQTAIHAVEALDFCSKEGLGGAINKEGNASDFWDAKGIVLIDGEYFANLLRQLQKAIKSKRPGKLTKGVLFFQDNAPARKSVIAMFTVHAWI